LAAGNHAICACCGEPSSHELNHLRDREAVRPHEGDALAYLMSIYKDPTMPENLRIDAAKAAIRYERPALAPVEQQAERDFVPLAERLKAYAAPATPSPRRRAAR
jgi:hypothetical protein